MDFDPNISYFAKINGGYGEPYVGLSQADRLEHMHVIGKTGMGKSTLIENVIYQDTVHGRGVGRIAPHGTTALRRLNCIPPSR